VPEIPEVESLARWLTQRTHGLTITKTDVLAISALKTFDPPLTALVGRRVDHWFRRGKYLIAHTDTPSTSEAPTKTAHTDTPSTSEAPTKTDPTDAMYLCIHLARAGWIKWSDELKVAPAKLTKGPQALRVQFSDGSGFNATEAGTDKRLSVHVVRDPDDVERIRTLGVDALGAEFTVSRFAEILTAAGRSQIKGVLTEQAVIAGVGNAYSDEALHVAKLSPFKPANSLDTKELGELHSAIVGVLTDALERSAGKPASELKDTKRTGMRVHGRAGEKCPICNDIVREVSFATKSLQYCATCQTGGKPLADRRLSKLLK
jgi:formamidopyrimidine-DNA glycosylase